MRMSSKARYAVRAMVSLSLYAHKGPVALKDISSREDISQTYLEQLFVKLRRCGIVDSVRGPGGGYVLGRPANRIRVDEIIESVEESLVPVSCMDDDGQCSCSNRCVTQSVWQGLGEKIRNFLSSITLEDLTRDAEARIGPLP